ncbi:MarC family protein [Fluviispira multicolorata]|nr:NAAT family transporter [Fluviispira multicolorata]
MSFISLLMEQNSTIGTSITYLFNTFVSVFVMVDPFAAIPVYLLLTERFTPADVKKTRRKSILVASAILLTFAITGMGVLNFFGISISALRIAGGILLLKFALEHLKGDSEKIRGDEEDESLTKDDISIVPLAMPLLAGPGAISTIVVQSTRGQNWIDFILLLIAIVLVMWVTSLTLKSSQYLFRLLGKTGLNLMGKIMGILIAAIAVEFMITGLRDSFPNLWN